jgi:hypothetical protein
MGIFPVMGYGFLKFEFCGQLLTVISPKQSFTDQRSTAPPDPQEPFNYRISSAGSDPI